MPWADLALGRRALGLILVMALIIACSSPRPARPAMVRRPVVITVTAQQRLEIVDGLHHLVADRPESLARVLEDIERDRHIEVRYSTPPPAGFRRRLGQALIDAGFTAVSILPEPGHRRR